MPNIYSYMNKLRYFYTYTFPNILTHKIFFCVFFYNYCESGPSFSFKAESEML